MVPARKISSLVTGSVNKVAGTTVVPVRKISKSKAGQGLKVKKIVAQDQKVNSAKAVQGPRVRKIVVHALRINRSKVVQDLKARKIVVQDPKIKGNSKVQDPKTRISAVQNRSNRHATREIRRSSSPAGSKVQGRSRSLGTKAGRIRIPAGATLGKSQRSLPMTVRAKGRMAEEIPTHPPTHDAAIPHMVFLGGDSDRVFRMLQTLAVR